MRPQVTLKLATTLDAVLVGIETAIKDYPELTVRLQGYEGYQPTRVVLDSKGRLPLNSKMVQTARVIPTYVVTTTDLPREMLAAQVKAIRVPSKHQRVDLPAALEALHQVGIERLFVEGGGVVATAFLRAGFVDRLEWFRSSTILGGDARPVIGHLNLERLDQMFRFTRLGVQSVGDDLWESYELVQESVDFADEADF
ncbi:MAG: RibD family protein [Asticcacaulis sp.]|nr:RibD family protein [Asticcacaulis sp.]